jgi:hypothetical protein
MTTRRHQLLSLLLAPLASIAMVGCAVGTPDDSGEKVAPRGSAYSYRVPEGFQKVDAIDKGDTPASFLTSVASPKTDQEGPGVIVGQLPDLPTVRDAADMRALLPAFEREVHGLQRAYGAKISGVTPTKLSGHLAARWALVGASGGPFPGLDAKITVIFTSAGDHAVNVTCRSGTDADERRLIDRACAEVLDSLRVE